MRGTTDGENKPGSDANRRVDPFHMPTELADGLEAESLPREVRPRFAPVEPIASQANRLDDACTVASHSTDNRALVGFSAPRLMPKA